MKNILYKSPCRLELCYNDIVTKLTVSSTALAVVLYALPCQAARPWYSPSGAGFPWLIIGGLIAMLIVGIVASAIVERRRDIEANDRYLAWLASVKAAHGALPTVAAEIRLKKGEVCYYKSTATLLEPRAVRKGSYGGGSIRLISGCSIHSGGLSSEAHDEWRPITTGLLFVTSERIIFDGSVKNRAIKLSEIMSVYPGYRSAVVNSHKLQKPIGFSAINGQIFATVVDSVSENASVS